MADCHNPWLCLVFLAILTHCAIATPARPLIRVPSPCFQTAVQLACSSRYSHSLEKCILNSVPEDYFIDDQNRICYVKFTDRCIPNFCTEPLNEKKDDSSDSKPASKIEQENDTMPTPTPTPTPTATPMPTPTPTATPMPTPKPTPSSTTTTTTSVNVSEHLFENSTDRQDLLRELLTPLGYTLFWTQFAFGILFFISSIILLVLVLWYTGVCAKRENEEQSNNEDDGTVQQQVSSNNEPDQSTNETQTDVGPPQDLNAAWSQTDHAQVQREDDQVSLYDNPHDQENSSLSCQQNPFRGWGGPLSSFQPVERVSRSIEWIPMVRPVAKIDKGTMTMEPVHGRPTMPPPPPPIENAFPPRSATIRRSHARYHHHSLGERPKQEKRTRKSSYRSYDHQSRIQTQDSDSSDGSQSSGPIRHLPPPPPQRTSSLRRKKHRYYV